MKQFIKEKYNILIPVFLGVVILIALFLYGREYRNNRYAYEKEQDVYQYFSKNKIEYKATISRNRKDVVLDIKSKDFNVSLDSTPIYIKDSDKVIFPKEMSAVFPIKDRQYAVNTLTEIYKKNDLYYLNQKGINKSFDYMFLYDGKDLYFFIDTVTLKVGDTAISAVSSASADGISTLSTESSKTDKAISTISSDTYEIIELNNTNSSVLVETKYMTIDVSSDEIIYKDDFTMLINNFSSLPKLVDNIENSGASN